jgi:hypothetical protein
MPMNDVDINELARRIAQTLTRDNARIDTGLRALLKARREESRNNPLLDRIINSRTHRGEGDYSGENNR